MEIEEDEEVDTIDITRGVLLAVNRQDIETALNQHFEEPSAETDPDPRDRRGWCVRPIWGVLSSHRDRHGLAFWILTQTFPKRTMIFLPEEYRP